MLLKILLILLLFPSIVSAQNYRPLIATDNSTQTCNATRMVFSPGSLSCSGSVATVSGGGGGSGIQTDGSSTTTATIPFAKGIDVTGSVDGSGDTTAVFIHVPLAQTEFAGRVDGYYTDGFRFDGEWKTNNASIINTFTFHDSTVWAPTATLQTGWSFGAAPVVKGSVNGTALYGVLSSPFTAPSGSTYSGIMATVAAYEAQQLVGSGTFTNYYYYHGTALGGSGTITNLYGLYLPDMTKGGTLNYGIYTGLGLNHFGDNVEMADGKNFIYNTTTGTKHGTATNQKQSFYNSTPIVQPTGDACTALQNLGLVASCTVTATTNANLTGPITSSGNATAVASQTGTGSVFVMQATPTLTTPVIGAATGTSLNLSGAITSLGVNNSGSMNADQATKTGNYTYNSFDHTIFCDATSGAVTITLPAISGQNRKFVVVEKIDGSTNTCTVTANGSEKLDSASSLVLRNQYESVWAQNDTSTHWWILARKKLPGNALQTTVNCATSGTIVASMPFDGDDLGHYREVIIYANACLGAATYTYPVAFTNTPEVISQSLAAIAAPTTTNVVVTGTTSTGYITLNGY